MRTLFYHTAPAWSGSSRAFAVAARGLAARGEEVAVVCRENTPAEEAFTREGLDVVPVPASDVSRDAWRLRTVLKDKQIEVVFLHTEREQLVAASAMRLGARGAVVRRVPAGCVPTAGTKASFASRMASMRLLFTTDQDRARAGLGDSAFLAPLGVDVERVNDVRAAARASIGMDDDTQLMVCVADRASRMRIATALRTVALLAERHLELRLALVGSGCDDDDTHMHASALGITPLVRFLGERDDLPNLVGAADVGWVAAEGDDGAFACLDFMAARVPVIAERSSLLSLYVPDMIAGVLLPPADPSDTAAAVANFLADDERRAAMGKAGRTRAARDFSEKAMIDGFAAVAAAAIDRGQRTAK
jgi:glycosyltransferase involved in cell wall biosynthesis